MTSFRTTFAREAASARILYRSGAVPRLRSWPGLIKIARRAGAAAVGPAFAHIHGDKIAIIDAAGSVTYRELGEAVTALTCGLGALVRKDGQETIGVMCRNSRYALLATFAGVGLGAKLVFLNTDMGARQLAEVCRREGVRIVVRDDEFQSACALLDDGIVQIDAWSEQKHAGLTIDTIVERSRGRTPARPEFRPDVIILTSGSTGLPKGASRGDSRPSLTTLGGFLQKIPVSGADRVFCGPPIFHGWGAIIALASLMCGATLVFDRRFDAQRAVNAVVDHQCTALMAVPTMLKRIVALDSSELARIDRSRLRVIGSGGAKLDTSLVNTVMATFGPVLHNLYGATEASYITIATPDDLLAEPACAGRPPLGVEVAIVRDGHKAPPGKLGEIYVRSGGQMAAYTSGETKKYYRGMLQTGDTGRVDAEGRLFVEGRSDGMIVSGGENVFPEQVEAVLGHIPHIRDVKVVPVQDADFGQRLRAYIVMDTTAELDVAGLKEHVARELSRPSVPRDFVVVADLPRGATGKVTSQTLAELAEAYGDAAVAKQQEVESDPSVRLS
ncbi:AMP-binding protein [Mycobacterium sp. PDNC021]|uniref:AMP-binding protein n=1 Tax=Mycobacterium sp. PDNC021 TaxID=3391399 RepID=UPI003AABA5A3